MVEHRTDKIKKIILAFVTIALLSGAICYFAWPKILANSKGQVFLASVYNNLENYNDIFARLNQASAKAPAAKAGVVSHHFLAKQFIADFYNTVSSNEIKTVFVISPDHFNNFFSEGTIAYTSYLPWKTPFGELDAGKNALDLLLQDKQFATNDSAVGLEHGIFVQAPFVKNFFPNAKIVPIILKNGVSDDIFYTLGKEIKDSAPENSFMVVSSDFSHGVSASQAKANDLKSIQVLKNIQSTKLDGATNDCRQCLAVLSGYLGDDQNYTFNLIDNTNSYNISSQDPYSVTSYVSGYYSLPSSAKILFAGDLMFDRGIRYYAAKNGGNGFIFDKISNFLQSADLAVVNLEGPITSNKSVSAGTALGSTNNFSFTFDPSVAQTLADQNIGLVDLGNNHILNFGIGGLDSTKSYLKQANVDFFGSPNGPRSSVQNINGLKIAFVGYNEFYGDANLEQSQALAEIQNIRSQADIVVVFCHWGIEYQPEPTDGQKDLAHKFVDAGADLVIGSHPHVVQPMEDYKDKKIYYSLGNFIFDQYFDQNVRNGLAVTVKIDLKTKQMDFTDQKIYLDQNGQTVLK